MRRLRFSALVAAALAQHVVLGRWNGARVSTHAASHTKGLPNFQGIIVISTLLVSIKISCSDRDSVGRILLLFITPNNTITKKEKLPEIIRPQKRLTPNIPDKKITQTFSFNKR